MNRKLSTLKKLGLGMMRLPENNGEIDIRQVKAMVDLCMENGFNYFDTAYVYHEGKSENIVKETIVARYPRKSFYIADKLPGWEIKQQSDVMRLFEEQLKKTGVTYFDFFLLHAINEKYLKIYDDNDCWAWGQQMKKEGRIINFGFSFHDTPEILERILSAHPEIDFIQLQINYADWQDEKIASQKCYELACKYAVPIIVMEPIKGGLLTDLHPDLEAVLKAIKPNDEMASWALRYASSLEGVALTLSGMSNLAQVEQNLSTYLNFVPLNDKEKKGIAMVGKALKEANTIPCTDCKYCVEGCPVDIKIPAVIQACNLERAFGNHQRAKAAYQHAIKGNNKASHCIACGKCETTCPQHIEIIDAMAEATTLYE